MKVSENTKISTDLKTILSIVAGVAVGVWAYFGLHESLSKTQTKLELMSKDLEENTEFRIKWPRGEMGSLPADSEQYLLIENNLVELEKITARVDAMMNNKVNIDRLIKDVDKVTEQLEILKDKVRANGKTNH